MPTGVAQGVTQSGYLARIKLDRALREPADAGAERLLPEFHAAALIDRLDQNYKEPLHIGSGNRGQNRLAGGHGWQIGGRTRGRK